MFLSVPALSLPRAGRGTQRVERPLPGPLWAGSASGPRCRASGLGAACVPAVRAPLAGVSPRFHTSHLREKSGVFGSWASGRALIPSARVGKLLRDPEPPAYPESIYCKKSKYLSGLSYSKDHPPRARAAFSPPPARHCSVSSAPRGHVPPSAAPPRSSSAGRAVTLRSPSLWSCARPPQAAQARPAVTWTPAHRPRLLVSHRRGLRAAAGTEAERCRRPRLRQRQPCAERRPNGGGDGRGERPERRPQPRRRPARGGQAACQRREGRLL